MGGAGAKGQYFFGRRLTREVDFFAFPRTGSHLFRYCTQGLFDLVAFEHGDLEHAEAISRQEELEPSALYALDLREDGVPFSPVRFNARVTGRHGVPVARAHPVVVLIRDPLATVYSLYRVTTTRWRADRPIADVPGWIAGELGAYAAFYDEAFGVLESRGDEGLLVRYESLVASAEPLEALVRLVGVTPKLRPAFVRWVTDFDRFVRPGERTFYRAGDDAAWRRDEAFAAAVGAATAPDLSRFGYGAGAG